MYFIYHHNTSRNITIFGHVRSLAIGCWVTLLCMGHTCARNNILYYVSECMSTRSTFKHECIEQANDCRARTVSLYRNTRGPSLHMFSQGPPDPSKSTMSVATVLVSRSAVFWWSRSLQCSSCKSCTTWTKVRGQPIIFIRRIQLFLYHATECGHLARGCQRQSPADWEGVGRIQKLHGSACRQGCWNFRQVVHLDIKGKVAICLTIKTSMEKVWLAGNFARRSCLPFTSLSQRSGRICWCLAGARFRNMYCGQWVGKMYSISIRIIFHLWFPGV